MILSYSTIVAFFPLSVAAGALQKSEHLIYNNNINYYSAASTFK